MAKKSDLIESLVHIIAEAQPDYVESMLYDMLLHMRKQDLISALREFGDPSLQ